MNQLAPSVDELRRSLPPGYSIEVGQDYPGFAAEMSRLLAEGYSELLVESFTTGTGTGQPTGIVTALGSMPGTDPVEAARIVLGELPDLMPLPELPARGVGADMLGRTAGLLVDLAVEVVDPAGECVEGGDGPSFRAREDTDPPGEVPRGLARDPVGLRIGLLRIHRRKSSRAARRANVHLVGAGRPVNTSQPARSSASSAARPPRA